MTSRKLKEREHSPKGFLVFPRYQEIEQILWTQLLLDVNSANETKGLDSYDLFCVSFESKASQSFCAMPRRYMEKNIALEGPQVVI